jgi:hypothetical protein
LRQHSREPVSSSAQESSAEETAKASSITRKGGEEDQQTISSPIVAEVKGTPKALKKKEIKKSKKNRKKNQLFLEEEEDIEVKGSSDSSPGEEDESNSKTCRWSPTPSDGGFKGPLPDIAQMSVDPPHSSSGDDFQTADFETTAPPAKMKTKTANKSKEVKRSVVNDKASKSNGKIANLEIQKNNKKVEKNSSTSSSSSDIDDDRTKDSFLVLDENEQMQVNSVDDFAKKLGCSPDSRVKVVSIFGNTGEGKSHTLNFTFFGGTEVFKTSPAQSSCTIGIWAAYDRKNKVITIDTEGLLGVSENNNRRTRLLLKVLAISDVIIYRTRAERLHNDLFSFLGDASRAYGQHFHTELREASKRSGQCYTPTDLGPVVVVFHETIHTTTLQRLEDKSPEDELRRRFQSLNLTTESYSAFEYVGTQTKIPPTSFKELQNAMRRHLDNTMVRSARKVAIVFGALKVSIIIPLNHETNLSWSCTAFERKIQWRYRKDDSQYFP